jgi:hypothetical protein
VRKLRRAHRDRIVQRESPVEQHQCGDCRHRLGYRRDAEDGVALDSKATRQVAAPDRRHVDDLAIAPCEGRSAGKVSGIDEIADRSFYSSGLKFHIEFKNIGARTRMISASAAPFESGC